MSGTKDDVPPPSLVEEEAKMEDAGNVEESSPTMFIKNLSVLPPLQDKQTNSAGYSVALPPIRAEEPVASLRAALGEVLGFAHLTSYRLVMENKTATATDHAAAAAPAKSNSDVISPFTGSDAIVSIPMSFKNLYQTDEEEAAAGKESNKNSSAAAQNEEIILDDYGDLQPLLELGLQDGSSFRVILERYDAGGIRDHVTRLRTLLDGNAPSTTSLVDTTGQTEGGEIDGGNGDAKESAGTNTVEKENKNNENDKDGNDNNEKKEHDAAAQKEEAKKKLAEKAEFMAKRLPKYAADRPITVDAKNLKDFYYLACGEEEHLLPSSTGTNTNSSNESSSSSKKKKKNKNKKKAENNKKDVATSSNDKGDSKAELSLKEKSTLLNELEERTRINCTIRYSGFHPPPPRRRLMGDLAYLEVSTSDPDEPLLFITAVPTGFYVNRSKVSPAGKHQFDPSPASVPCFSHTLLDCLLQKSQSLRETWSDAIAASKERAELTSTSLDSPLQSLFRVAVRGDFNGFNDPSSAMASTGIDTVILRPSWLVPTPTSGDSWNHNDLHEYNATVAENDLGNMFGMDPKLGLKDWNDELQSAREMPKTSLNERIERARVIHKVLSEFGEAAVVGVKAICDGHVAPMNPNEPARTHVYLLNNIFFSRAVDAGVETMKVARGDAASKKSAARDAHCMGCLHRMDISGLYSLATVLVDYLGTRFVCQSIVPGILLGEKTHTLLYGAVEASCPLAWDKGLHETLEESLGKLLMVASRKVPKKPLSDELLDEIEKKRSLMNFLPEIPKDENSEDDKKATITICAPMEAKGIRGSDQRDYILDLVRLTPRDANWVPESQGGTGKWETAANESPSNGKGKRLIPDNLEDDEFVMNVIRPELVTLMTQKKMKAYLEEKEEKKKKKDKEEEESKNDGDSTKKDSDEGSDKKSSKNAENEQKEDKEEKKEPEEKITKEDEAYLESLRYNVNVFLPGTRSLESIDAEAYSQLKEDEERAREVATYLWDQILPSITQELRDSANNVPVDGKNLTDFLHQRGVNCRYLGQLATLAAKEEEQDRKVAQLIKSGQVKRIPRRLIPECWLDILECEMVARAARHVLDSYLTENGCAAATQPAQTIASFLSALVSSGEETAGETEMRLEKEGSSIPDDDEFNSLTMFDTGGKGDTVLPPVRSRGQIWSDIETEVARRFRYTLTLYNTSASSHRALYVPLLRRVCQRTGVRLVARNYAIGGKCLCSGGNSSGGRLTASYPISPVDIVEVVPLVKHAAAHGGEGFVPYTLSASGGPPSLHIALPDAKATLEAAHYHYQARALPQALELAQEAAALYQRVTDTAMHASVARCLDLTSAILFEAGEPQMAAANAARSLGLLVQLNGFDCADVMTAHSTLSHIFLNSGVIDSGIKHLRAASYLMELMAGPRYVELCNAYHKLGSLFHECSQSADALRFYEEASTRPSCDRLMEAMISKSMAIILANLGKFKEAVDSEKKAYRLYGLLVGDDHDLTKSSVATLQKLTQMAVEQGKSKVVEDKKRLEEEAADAIASQIEADEAEESKKKKKKKGKKKK